MTTSRASCTPMYQGYWRLRGSNTVSKTEKPTDNQTKSKYVCVISQNFQASELHVSAVSIFAL